MPAFVTHELAGRELLSRLSLREKRTVGRAPWAYFWGLQGPDLLFFRDAVRGKSSLPQMGSFLHQQDPGELLGAMAAYAAGQPEEEREMLLAYCLGFVGHYVMDTQLHPYVYAQQVRISRQLPEAWRGGVHFRIESEMDTAYYRCRTGRAVQEYAPAPRLWGTRAQRKVIAGLYEFLLREIYGFEVEPGQVEACFADTRRIMGLTLCPWDGVQKAAWALEGLGARWGSLSGHIRPRHVDWDVLNLAQRPWQSPEAGSAPDCRSVPQLVEAACRMGEELCAQLAAAVRSGQELVLPGLPSFDRGAPVGTDC